MDATESIILTWLSKDIRFRYFSIPNGGVSNARNFGLEHAKGVFVQFLDADDLIATTKLTKSIQFISLKGVDVVCSNYDYFSDTLSNSLGTFSNLERYNFTFQNIARYLNAGFTIPIHCFFFKREVISNHRFPIGITAQEDWVMWLQIYQHNPKTYFTSETLAYYRFNPFGRTNLGGLFNETLLAVDYLNPKLSRIHFKILYESVIMRYEEGLQYWKKREEYLKKSKTYQFGLICKKFVIKSRLLPLAKKVFDYFVTLNK